MPNTPREQAAHLARRRRAGICTRCPQPTTDGHTTCEACREKAQTERRLERLTPRDQQARISRACLRCDHLFISWGAENRLCERCREALAISPSPEEERRVMWTIH